jgi:hypothetical protein
MDRKTKKFDCVKMKWRGAQRVLQEISGMTIEEELRYWEQGTQELLARQEALRAAKSNDGSDKKQAA